MTFHSKCILCLTMSTRDKIPDGKHNICVFPWLLKLYSLMMTIEICFKNLKQNIKVYPAKEMFLYMYKWLILDGIKTIRESNLNKYFWK